MCVSLRPIERDDLNALHKWRNTESIFSQLGGGFSPTSRTEMEKWMDNFSANVSHTKRFIIEFEGVSVGYISLNNINYINRNAELGIYIGESNFHGKGIASKALNQLEEFSKNHLNLKKIKLLVNENNTPAIKLYEKLNYNQVGKMIEERYINNQWVNVLMMEKMI